MESPKLSPTGRAPNNHPVPSFLGLVYPRYIPAIHADYAAVETRIAASLNDLSKALYLKGLSDGVAEARAFICWFEGRNKDLAARQIDSAFKRLAAEQNIEKAIATCQETLQRCPRCDSPSPELHPAVQHEGEVELCSNPFHKVAIPEPPPESASPKPAAPKPAAPEPASQVSFRKRLEGLINECSQEQASNTPDFILAEFLLNCLRAYERAVQDRDRWYGEKWRHPPGEVVRAASTSS